MSIFLQENDLCTLREFILKTKPHAICVGAESNAVLAIVSEVKDIIKVLVAEENFPPIPVEIIDNNVAKVFAKSVKGRVSADERATFRFDDLYNNSDIDFSL